MANGPAPFPEIGKKAKDLLNKDYNFGHKFTLSMLSDSGMALTATGVKSNQFFLGDISTQYKSGKTTVDVKVDTRSNVSTTITTNEIFPRTRMALNFKIPDHKSGKGALLRFRTLTRRVHWCLGLDFSCRIQSLPPLVRESEVQDNLKIRSWVCLPTLISVSPKLDVQYLHPHAAINSSIGLTPTPFLELATTIGTKELSFGGEVGFDTASASLIKCNAGIGLNKPDFSAALILGDKGDTLKASYIHLVNPVNGTSIAAEMTHRFSTYENSFTVGSSHSFDPYTIIKTRFCHRGKVAMLCQREWRPKSLVTFSAEYDPKVVDAPPKFGLALALKP